MTPETFRIGLIYGPSGCGKSSFVKAGLLPRLNSSVRSVYVECSADETELRIEVGARRTLELDASSARLTELLGHVRRGRASSEAARTHTHSSAASQE